MRVLLSGVLSMGFGLALSAGAVIALASSVQPPPPVPTGTPVSFDVAPPPPPPPKRRPTQRPKPKRRAAVAPPSPVLGAGLAGLDVGLDLFGGTTTQTSDLVGDVGDVVMTEDAVDAAPRPVRRTPPSYPARARAKNLTGFVRLSLLVGADGSVRDVRVLEGQPPGIFEDAAVSALRSWQFDAATYEGRPVAVRVEQMLRFELE